MTEFTNLGDDRAAQLRANYLARAHDLREPVALALAYRHLGYSHSGIAGKIDRTEATVAGYMAQIADEYGSAAVESRLPAELAAFPAVPLDGADEPKDGQ